MNRFISSNLVLFLDNIIIFLTGFLTIVHMMAVIPYSIYAGLIILLYGFTLIIATKGKISKASSFLSWYGIFLILILFSYTYTVNDINPEYVMKRVLVIGSLALLADIFIKTPEKFIVFVDGIISGSLVVCIFVMIYEGYNIGITRIGATVCGSAVAFSGIAMIGTLCTMWKLIHLKDNRKRNIILTILFLGSIILSGSRRAIILSVIFIILLIIFASNIKKNKKIIMLLISVIVIYLILYLILNNEVLYDMIGWRIESMIMSLIGNENIIDESMNERNIMANYAYELFSKKPFLGYGIHGFAYKFNFYYGKLLYSHTGFGEILSCYGLVGFFIYYSIFTRYLKRINILFNPVHSCQVFIILYAMVILLTEFHTISFLTPYAVVLLTVGLNLIKLKKDK